MQGLDCGIEVLQIPQVCREDILIVHDLRALCFDKQNGSTAIKRNRTSQMDVGQSHDREGDCKPNPCTLHENGDQLAPVWHVPRGLIILNIRDIRISHDTLPFLNQF